MPQERCERHLNAVASPEEAKHLPPANSAARPWYDAEGPLTQLAGDYLVALLARETDQARQLVFDALEAGAPLAGIYTHVLRPSQREVGRLWQLNRLTVTQEHYCTAATQVLMSRLCERTFESPRRGTQILLAAVECNQHELGIRMLADLFELAGWTTHYVGAMPVLELCAAVTTQQPHIVALSASMDSQLAHVKAAVQALRATPGAGNCRIMVGGAAFHHREQLWRHVGADGYGDEAEDAIAWANSQVPAGYGARGAHA